MIVYLSFSIWKCLTYLKRLDPIIYWVDVSQQETIVDRLQLFYVELMNDLRDYKIIISSEFYGHLEQMLEIASGFEVIRDNVQRKRILRALLDNISEYADTTEKGD